MRFDSLEFLLFFGVVFGLYWIALRKSNLAGNILLLLASYLFYGWWNPKFLLLIFFSSMVDYWVGMAIPSARNKKAVLAVSVVVNIGLLMFFKYFNFFITSFQDLLEVFGMKSNVHTLSIILPVGISFYTFQTMSYSLDIYRGRIKPEKNLILFLNYVSFFPQLVAGPIERAATFLPQFRKVKVFQFDEAVVGMRLILYGFFKKIVISDNLARGIDPIFANPTHFDGGTILLASFLFSVQLYADFSAYTDIARGIAKLLGFELVRNFQLPLFAQSVPDFWSRWHISLTTWFRDYLFIPLAKVNKQSTLWRIVATIILFVIIGFWHGANYTFILFGFLHGLAYIPRILARKNRKLQRVLQWMKEGKVKGFISMLLTFSITGSLGVVFRSDNLNILSQIIERVTSQFNEGPSPEIVLKMVGVAFCFVLFEWFMRHKSHPFDIAGFPSWARRSIYVFMMLTIFLLGHYGMDPFYYFQF